MITTNNLSLYHLTSLLACTSIHHVYNTLSSTHNLRSSHFSHLFPRSLLGLLLLTATTTNATKERSSSWDYSTLLSPPKYTGITFDNLPGFTRSVYERNWALITPESHVFQANPAWRNATTAHLISPTAPINSKFAMYMAKMKENSIAQPQGQGIERFIFVLDGIVTVEPSLSLEGGGEGGATQLHAGDFAYLPPPTTSASTDTFFVKSSKGAGLLVYERYYAITTHKKGDQQPMPKFRHGSTDDQPLIAADGEVFRLRKLLPQTQEYDFNIHVMDFFPGEYLNVKEVHYNQHGLLLLAGKGIYRLGESWMPVSAGDAIWMAPYVPQWFGALGTEESRYIIFKDTTIDPLN